MNDTWTYAGAEPAADAWLNAALVRVPHLSARERQVFELLGEGRDNRAVARALAISERTAKRHLSQVMLKLGCESRLQVGLVALATRIGFSLNGSGVPGYSRPVLVQSAPDAA